MTVDLIGGEMVGWSDLDGTHGPPPAGGAALPPLLAAITGRTLVAGPHDPALIDAVPASPLTVLVRGVTDAEALAARYASRPDVTVCCGSLEKFAAVPAFDAVIALDGLDRLCSAEAAELSREEILTRLLAVLRPPGRLLLAVPNPFGTHRLAALPPSPADTEWVQPEDADPAVLRARLPGVRSYAVYPSPAAPAVLIGEEALADPALRGFLAATIGDPAAAGALRQGLGNALAPGWIFEVGGDRGPALITATGAVGRAAGGGWETGGGTPVPLGRTLDDLLLSACRRRAMPAVRDLLTAWQSGDAAGVPAGRIVVDADGRLRPVAPAVVRGGVRSSSDDALVALRDLAARLIAGGFAELWPTPADEAELTALLAGMTGRELDPSQVPPAAGRRELPSTAELLATRDRLERELAEARALHAFQERAIADRDAELTLVRRRNAVLAATVPGRAVVAAGKALRAVVRRARR